MNEKQPSLTDFLTCYNKEVLYQGMPIEDGRQWMLTKATEVELADLHVREKGFFLFFKVDVVHPATHLMACTPPVLLRHFLEDADLSQCAYCSTNIGLARTYTKQIKAGRGADAAWVDAPSVERFDLQTMMDVTCPHPLWEYPLVKLFLEDMDLQEITITNSTFNHSFKLQKSYKNGPNSSTKAR